MVSWKNKLLICSNSSRPTCTFFPRIALSVWVRSWLTNCADLSLPNSFCAFSSLSNSSRSSCSTRCHSVSVSSFSIFLSNSRRWFSTSFFSDVFSLSVRIDASSSCKSLTLIPLSDKISIPDSASANPFFISVLASSMVCFLLVSSTFSTVVSVARKCSDESTFSVTSTKLFSVMSVSTSSPVITTSATCS